MLGLIYNQRVSLKYKEKGSTTLYKESGDNPTQSVIYVKKVRYVGGDSHGNSVCLRVGLGVWEGRI